MVFAALLGAAVSTIGSAVFGKDQQAPPVQQAPLAQPKRNRLAPGPGSINPVLSERLQRPSQYGPIAQHPLEIPDGTAPQQ